MSRVFLATELETVAVFWRILRRDGVALGLISHDRDLWFDGLLHRAAPGMVPSAIERQASLEPEQLAIEGALTHDAISSADLKAGRFDAARIAVGVVDWQSLERLVLVAGQLATLSQRGDAFEAELITAKAVLAQDRVARTSPACRAAFCGAACGLSAARFTHLVRLQSSDPASSTLAVALPAGLAAARLAHGRLRWLDGPFAGQAMAILAAQDNVLQVDRLLDPAPTPGARALVLEGCDHTLATCHGRFGNAINFQGEPFLPGNDLLARYPVGA